MPSKIPFNYIFSHLGKSAELFIEKLTSLLLNAIKSDVGLPDAIKPQLFTALISLFQTVRNSKNSKLTIPAILHIKHAAKFSPFTNADHIKDQTFTDLTTIICETIQRYNFPPFRKNEQKKMIGEMFKDRTKNTRSNMQVLTSKEYKESVDKAKTKKNRVRLNLLLSLYLCGSTRYNICIFSY